MAYDKEVMNETLQPVAEMDARATHLVLEAMTAVTTDTSIGYLLSDLAGKIVQLLDVTSVTICDLDTSTGISTLLANLCAGSATEAERRDVVGTTFDLFSLDNNPQWLWDQEPIIVHRATSGQFLWKEKQLRRRDCRSVLCIPLVVEEITIGHIDIWENRRQRPFSTKEVSFARHMAMPIAMAISRTRQKQIVTARSREVDVLMEVGSFLSSTLDLYEVLQRLLDAVRLYLSGIQSCSVSILDEQTHTLNMYVGWDESPDLRMIPVGSSIPIDETISSRLAMESGEPVVIADVSQLPFSNQRLKKMVEMGLRSILYTPLMIREKPVGILHIHVFHEPRVFLAEELALVQSVANQAAIAIENANLFKAERTQLQLAQTLQKVGALLTTSLSLEAVYEQIFDLLAEVVEYDSVSLQLVDMATENLTMTAWRGFGDIDIEFAEKMVRKNSSAIFNKITVPPGWTVISDTYKDSRWIRLPGYENLRSWIGAALVVKDRVIGILNVDSHTAGKYNKEEGETIAAFANQAAIAIENARLHDETVQQANELSILHQVAAVATSVSDVDELITQTTRLVARNLYTHAFGFVMMDGENNVLCPHPSYHGLDPGSMRPELPLDRSVVGKAARLGQPLNVPDVSKEPLYFLGTSTTQSELAVPLLRDGRVIGVINIESPQLDDFSEHDTHFLTTLADTITAALERIRLYDALEEQAESLAQTVAAQTAEIKRDKDQMQAILESAGEGILLTDTEARIQYVNRALEKQSGYTLDELKGQNTRILGSGQMPDAVFDQMWETLSNKHHWSGELVNRRKDGTIYDVSTTITPILDNGQISGYVSVQADISYLKEVDRLKSEFISNVSHELRTPLTNIKTYISLLERGKPENFPRYFSVIHQETDRLGRLIQDLLDISRLDSEIVPNFDARISSEVLLKRLMREAEERASVKNVAFYYQSPLQYSMKSPDLCMEEHHAERALSNVLDNAFIYTEPGDTITMSVSVDTAASHEYLLVQIQDSGVGIDDEDLPHIFDRFFQGKAAIEKHASGTGLGLAIAREIVTRYGGKIEVQSKVGKGTLFSIWLPID